MATRGLRSQSETELVDETSSTSTIPTQNQQSNLSPIIINTIKLFLKSVLTRFHAGYFRISLSLGGQTLLWKALLEPRKQINPLHHLFIKLYPSGLLALWSISFFVLAFLSIIYILRCLFFFKMVKAEFVNHVGVNYLFAPWISWLLLLESSPFLAPKTASYLVFWWIFAVPVVVLDIKIYGQWFTKGKKFLSTAANPTCQMSVIGNLVGAQAAANMGWKESAVFLFSLGMVHYLVLLVTLYQRLSGSDKLPAMLRPVFFLFIAAPSVASLAWEAISGAFDTGSKMLFFLSLFLFTTLIFRPMLFRRAMKRFNIAWWAYSFPITVLALASSEYAEEVKGVIAYVMMLLLLALSVLVCFGLVVFTLINSKMLLPDDDPTLNLLDLLPTASQ